MAAVLEKQAKRWTYEEYYRLDDDQRYEIIDGNLLMAPAPDTWHQSWARNLFRIVDAYVQRKKIGEVFFAPLDVVLNQENTVQPDLVFISSANLNLLQRRGIFGTPDLMVEMVSVFSVRRDRYDKKDLYARFGVKEYWIIDLKAQQMLVDRRSRDRWVKKKFQPSDTYRPKLLPEFEFACAPVFQAAQ